MKISTLVLLTALLSISHCQEVFRAYQGVSTENVPDDFECYLTLRVNSSDAGINLYQSFPRLLHPWDNCTNPDVHFYSFFDEDLALPSTVTFNNDSGVVSGIFDEVTFLSLNGTACVLIPGSIHPNDRYVCHFKFSLVHMYFVVYGTGSGSSFAFQPKIASDQLILPNFANFHTPTLSYNKVQLNASFPQILAAFVDSSCTPNSATNPLALNSSIKISSATNLTANLPGTLVRYVIFRQRGTTNYYSGVSPSNATVFGNQGDSLCYTLPMLFSDVLPSADYCGGQGCDVAIVLTNTAEFTSLDRDIFVLHTSGVIIGTPVDAGNGGNGGSGNGNGGNGNGNGGNGGGNPVGNSAAINRFNICLLIVALIALFFH